MLKRTDKYTKEIIVLIDERRQLKEKLKIQEENLKELNKQIADLIRKNQVLKRKIYTDGGMPR